ncbi:hypothetical protein GCM10007426_43150 [Alloalcanivorax dieselolei]|nr:hypothetical protein GCM10007426_43150 [Alloalcanivorax dieselolei]
MSSSPRRKNRFGWKAAISLKTAKAQCDFHEPLKTTSQRQQRQVVEIISRTDMLNLTKTGFY